VACHYSYELPWQGVEVAAYYLLLVLAASAADLVLASALQLCHLCPRAVSNVGLFVRCYTSVFKGLCYLLLLRVIREGRLRVPSGALD
jgi:hypothetical protein